MASTDFDPRVYYAAERTLLAWLRTGLTVMGFGFVIARFGLFLQIVALEAPAAAQHAHTGISAAFGIVLVAAGTLMILASGLEHRRFLATLPADRPALYRGSGIAFASTGFIALVGIAMTTYLAITAA